MSLDKAKNLDQKNSPFKIAFPPHESCLTPARKSGAKPRHFKAASFSNSHVSEKVVTNDGPRTFPRQYKSQENLNLASFDIDLESKSNTEAKEEAKEEAEPEQVLLPPFRIESDPDPSQHISHSLDSDSDASAKKVHITKLVKLERHKPMSYSFKEPRAFHPFPDMPSIECSLNLYDSVDDSSLSSHNDENTVARRLLTPINILIFLLSAWAICSIILIVYGLDAAFRQSVKHR